MNFTMVLHAVLPCCLLVGGTSAQVPELQNDIPSESVDGTPIHAVRFEGLSRVSQTFCRNRVRTKPFQPFSSEVLKEDVRILLRTGKFLDAQAEHSFEHGQLVVTYFLKERPVITSLELEGNLKFSDKRLLKELGLEIGDPLNRFAIQQGANIIAQLYKEAGYAGVKVEVDQQLLRTEQTVVYTIEEGPRVRIRSILFEGNVAFAKRELLPRISTKTYVPLFRTGDFNPDRAEHDAAQIQNFYRDRGYLDARVSYRTDALDLSGGLAIVYLIHEGDLYHISSIRFRGNNAFTHDELQAAIRLHPGDTMRLDFLRKDLEILKQTYGQIGYLDATVRHARVFTEQPGEVLLTFDITEGSQFTVGRIVIRGNEQTKDKVIRRELEFYPEEFFDTVKLEQSETNIRSTGLFRLANITPVGDQPGVRDVLVDVTESEQTTRFIIAGGVGSNSGLAGTLSFESRNFDIRDWPRSWGEFIRGRSFRGAGQYFRLALSPGTELSTFRIDFRDPYFLDKPLRFGTSFYLFERGRADYDEQRTGANLSLRKRFDEGILKGWSGEISFRLEDVNIDDLVFFPAEDIAEAEGHNLLTSARILMIRNRTDSRFFPTKGDVWTFSYEQAVGDHTFGKLQAGYTWYKTLRVDELDRPSVLALKADAGYIVGDAPVFERFYAGGIGSMRGFAFRGISPRDGPFFDDDQRIGGSFRVMTGAEYSFPLWTETMRGVVFADMGTVEEDFELTSWRASIGVGFRIYIDMFGPIPLEFNLAAPVASDGDDDTQVFSFAIGITF